MHYKAPDNSIHFLDDDSFAYLLPAGSFLITDEEVEALKPQPDPKEAIKAQIATLEASITPRRLREALLSGDTAFITGVDAQIAALREQL
jgi:hypothetical protein